MYKKLWCKGLLVMVIVSMITSLFPVQLLANSEVVVNTESKVDDSTKTNESNEKVERKN
ncbi:MAG: hypothetical protein N2749_00265 [Clostridia bacterium]|nr:hypothetical protein [Clostridia bacterium]